MYKIVGQLETERSTVTISVKNQKIYEKPADLVKNNLLEKNEHSTVSNLKLISSISSSKELKATTTLPKINKKFECLVCNITFANRNLLLSHLNTVHAVPLLPCDLCKEHFADLIYLQRHKENVHSEQMKSQETKVFIDKIDEEYDNVESADDDHLYNVSEVISPSKEIEEQQITRQISSTQEAQLSSDNIEIPQEAIEDENDQNPWWGLKESPKTTKRVKVLKHKRAKSGVLQMFGKRGRPTENMVAEWKKRRSEIKEIEIKVENNDDYGKTPKRKRRKPTREPKEFSGMCQICGEIKVCLATHIRKVHSEASTCGYCCGKIIEGDPKPHKCLKKRHAFMCTCGEEFSMKEQIQGHMIDKDSPDHRAQCYDCTENFQHFQQYLDHLDEVHPAPFTCEICQKGFYKKNHLQMHIYFLHMVERKIRKCNVCGADCVGDRSLRRHIMRVHRAVCRVTCEICKLTFYDKHTLKRHMDNKHNEKKKYTCDVCKKDFSTACSLKYHFTIHTGDRPFPCPFCSKTFKINSELRKHYRAHKELTIKCPSCSLYCLNEEDLRRHMRRYPAHDIANSIYVSEQIE